MPTWVEYVRHNTRRTKADADVYDRLLALHRGASRPRVHRMIERQTVPVMDDTPLKPHPEVPETLSVAGLARRSIARCRPASTLRARGRLAGVALDPGVAVALGLKSRGFRRCVFSCVVSVGRRRSSLASLRTIHLSQTPAANGEPEGQSAKRCAMSPACG